MRCSELRLDVLHIVIFIQWSGVFVLSVIHVSFETGVIIPVLTMIEVAAVHRV